MTDDAQLEPIPTSDRGQLVLLGLIAVALIASVIMLVTGSIGVLKLAMVVALWAAVLSIFLASKYRAELVRERAEFAEELAFERQASQQALAQREAEAVALQQSVHSEASTDSATAAATDTATAAALAEITEQLAQVRAQLESLTGAIFAEPNMVLQAEAIRIQALEKTATRQQREELTAGQTQHTQSAADAVPAAGVSTPSAQPDSSAKQHLAQESAADDASASSAQRDIHDAEVETTAEATASESVARPARPAEPARPSQPAQPVRPAQSAQPAEPLRPARPIDGAEAEAATETETEAEADVTVVSNPVFDAQAVPTHKWTIPATTGEDAAATNKTSRDASTSQAKVAPQEATTSHTAPATHATDTKQQSLEDAAAAAKRHGRRRREETGGLSVAELLKKQGR
ncbi:DUF6779 domain-containing protein [Corynebacterium sp. HS2168-gen11]|uniref:DUF6779 domain-containing protein n=1 Tax=Corynebacterium sp. HS2168-gen11 TaxID=2974027 RepID=UPI00216B1FA5|nr:DUF6779 domain-containing protein [Corynebacterium sp. HS2168-gen11]MCS4536106.1 hypothetical protein [Corynebacterium sp. HS2168-gen11]